MPVTRKLRKSRRAVQMREAQRRRRQRLKEQQQSFLQIILPARLRDRLVTLSEATGVTLQEAALDILLGALAPDPINFEEALHAEFEAAEKLNQESAPAAPRPTPSLRAPRSAQPGERPGGSGVPSTDDSRQLRLF